MLVVLALLMQIGGGAFTTASPCCKAPPVTVKPCCAHKAPKASIDGCPCHQSEQHCRCVATADNRATPTASPRTVSVSEETDAAPIITPRPALFALARTHTPASPPAHESPPGIPRAVTLPLII